MPSGTYAVELDLGARTARAGKAVGAVAVAMGVGMEETDRATTVRSVGAVAVGSDGVTDDGSGRAVAVGSDGAAAV